MLKSKISQNERWQSNVRFVQPRPGLPLQINLMLINLFALRESAITVYMESKLAHSPLLAPSIVDFAF